MLAELLRARLDHLAQGALQELQAAAVLTSPFDYALLRRMSGRGEEVTILALDMMLGASILAERNRIISLRIRSGPLSSKRR